MLLSICIALKNRSLVNVEGKNLAIFPNCIDSIKTSLTELRLLFEYEIIIVDFQSDDWPLELWIRKRGLSRIRIVTKDDEYFSKGKGLNEAVTYSSGKCLLFLDADMIVNALTIDKGIQYFRENKCFFPICYSYSNIKHDDGYWRASGYGNCFIGRSVFNAVGGWQENDKWGGEDNDMYNKISRLNIAKREKVKGLFHQWHPNERKWKNRYYENGMK